MFSSSTTTIDAFKKQLSHNAQKYQTFISILYELLSMSHHITDTNNSSRDKPVTANVTEVSGTALCSKLGLLFRDHDLCVT